jgi:hypothetical protein
LACLVKVQLISICCCYAWLTCHCDTGRVDPVPFQIKRDLTGLGKTNQDVRMIETTVSQRRGLDSERQQKETEDQRRAREVSGAAFNELMFIITIIITGHSCSPRSLTIRDFQYPGSILLCPLLQAIPKCSPIRRTHEFLRPPS